MEISFAQQAPLDAGDVICKRDSFWILKPSCSIECNMRCFNLEWTKYDITDAIHSSSLWWQWDVTFKEAFLESIAGHQRYQVWIFQHMEHSSLNRASWASHSKCIFHNALILAWPQILWLSVGCTLAPVTRKMAFLQNLVAKGHVSLCSHPG